MGPSVVSGRLRWPPVLSAAGHALLWLWLGMWLAGVTSQRVFREDQLALLSSTLRTFQVASCDGERLRLECPRGTTVSIQLVQYGRLATKPDLCGAPGDMRRFNYTDCLDRSALKVVIDACGGKRQCQLHTSAALFGVDPCPGISKFVEVLYKCRPTEFRTKVVCQGQRRPIYCDQDRVAIYSASFGTKHEGSVHCPQPPGVQLTDCHASFTSEKMISRCQGKPSCELTADPELFTRACPPDHNMYLTTKYTCVPKEILREQYATEVDEDYQQNMTEAPAPELEEAPVEPSEMEARDVPPVDQNGQERLILYLTLGVTVCLLIGLGVLVGRLCVRRKAKSAARHEPPPPGFATDLDPPDSELDLGTGSSVLGTGRLMPPHAAPSSFRPPPPLTSDPYRYQVPCRERERESLSPASHQTRLDDGFRPSEVNYGDSMRGGMGANFGDNLLDRNPVSADSLRRGVKFSDNPRGRDTGYGSLRPPPEANFGSSLHSDSRSDSLERMESDLRDLRQGLLGNHQRVPCRTVPDAMLYSYKPAPTV